MRRIPTAAQAVGALCSVQGAPARGAAAQSGVEPQPPPLGTVSFGDDRLAVAGWWYEPPAATQAAALVARPYPPADACQGQHDADAEHGQHGAAPGADAAPSRRPALSVKGGRLSAAERKALPDSAFAGPNRSFPVNDKNHARAALSMIGNAPPAARAKIKARANAKLGKASSKPTGKGGGAGKHPVGCGCGNH